MKVCPGCAADNDDGAIFCAACGDVIEWESDAGPAVSDRRGASRFGPPEAPQASPPQPTAPPAPTPPPRKPPEPEPEPEPANAPPPSPAAWLPPEATPTGSEQVAPAEPAPVPDATPAAEPVSPPSEPAAAPVAERPPAPPPTPEPEADPAPDPAIAERVRRLVARSNLVPVADPVEAPTPQRAPSPEAPPPSLPSSGSLAAAIQIAERSGRTDLASRLRVNREQIQRTGVTVAVVGEFKKGKSSLVNALINAEVCPSDPVDATVTPIVVGYGEELAVTIERKGVAPTRVDLPQVAHFGSEAGNEANHLGVSRIEITVPRRLLASGLGFLDTPGVGGLESAAGALNLAVLEHADGVLFVTDCSQELTAPEIAYLTAAHQRCSTIVCVMTKLDLQVSAEVLAAHNRRHLDAAGLDDIEVLTVSSVLHLLSLAQGDARLEQESGFGGLFDAIHRAIWEPARRRGLADAGHQLADLAEHLAMPLDAAQRAKGSEQAAQQTIARLTEAQDRVRQFRSGAARWQQRLADGMQDATVDLDHDLRTRLRTLARLADARVDEDVPADELIFEAWVNKTAIESVVAHYESIADRTNALADEVSQYFTTLDRQAAFQVEATVPTELLAAVHVNREQRLLKDGVARRIITTGHGYSSGMVLVSSVVGVVSALPWIPLLALPFAGAMARRAFSDDRDRRRAAHRQELKRLATRYLDEIGFIVHKDSRDTLRRIHRDIREHYAARAEQVDRTLQQALASAEQARAQPSAASRPSAPSQPDDRATLRQVVSAAQRLVAGAPRAS